MAALKVPYLAQIGASYGFVKLVRYVGAPVVDNWSGRKRRPAVFALARCWQHALFVLARYTFMLWLPFYLQDSLGLEPASAAYVSTMFDIGGGIGSPLCGIVADKLCRTCKLLGTSCATMCTSRAPCCCFRGNMWR